MRTLRERHVVGLPYLESVTALLQRIRGAHATAGLYEAADLQWWWRTARSTDTIVQRFWVDDNGLPEAAFIATDWGDRVALAPMVKPGASCELLSRLLERGMVHAADMGWASVTVEVDRSDDTLADLLVRHGFHRGEPGVVETWLAADARPAVSPLDDGYRLADRQGTVEGPHHMASRNGPDVEARLRQTSLYRPDLDLSVRDAAGDVAAYGLFWFDPTSATGLVEPMRTEEAHRRRGLARHILTAGVERLAQAGATRIKICYEPDNVAARDLYLGVGFRPHRETIVFAHHAADGGTKATEGATR